jgi:hypothetical protein
MSGKPGSDIGLERSPERSSKSKGKSNSCIAYFTCCLLLTGSSLSLLFVPENGGGTFLEASIRRVHSVILQNIILFINTSMRNSNPVC